MRLLPALAALLLVLAPSSSAAKPQPLGFDQTWRLFSSVIKQQSRDKGYPDPATSSQWVYNPTSCAWDADDKLTYGWSFGYLEPGATVMAPAECLIADNIRHVAGISVGADSPDLLVTVTLERDFTVITSTAIPVPDASSGWRYLACIISPGGNWTTELIDGSNGGWGRRWEVSFTVTSQAIKTVRDISLMAEVDNSHTPTQEKYGCVL